MKAKATELNREKAKEIVQYIVYLTGKNPRAFGKTKLHKILWFYEGFMMLATGKRAIGGKFIKNRFGPTLEELDSIIEELEKEGTIRARKVPELGFYSVYYRWMFEAVPPKLEHLSKEEIELISYLVCTLGKEKASELSRYTHTPAFRAKKEYEELNPLMILHHFVRKPVEEELEEAKRFVQLAHEGNYDEIVEQIKKELEPTT